MELLLKIVVIIFIVFLLFLYFSRSRRKIKSLQKALNSASLELQNVQKAFHRFAPQKVVEEIISNGVSAHGERQEVTVLFADIKGFVNLAENIQPELLVEILNGYFRAMTLAINGQRGYVSKFIGDGLMALFGTPKANKWHVLDAVWAALAMRKALEKYNEELKSRNLPPLKIGVGIHTGQAVAGVLGNEQLMEFTVIGDVVNTASRIESQTRKYEVDILISSDVQRQLDNNFKVNELPPLEVKGKSSKLHLYELVAYEARPK